MAKTKAHIETAARSLRVIEETLRAAGADGCKLIDIVEACGISDTQAAIYVQRSKDVLVARVPRKHMVRYFHVSQQEARDKYYYKEIANSGKRYSDFAVESVLSCAHGGKSREQIEEASGYSKATVMFAINVGIKERGLQRQRTKSGVVVWWAAHEKVPGGGDEVRSHALGMAKKQKGPTLKRELRQTVTKAGVRITRGRDFVPNARYSVERPEPVFSRMRYGEYL